MSALTALMKLLMTSNSCVLTNEQQKLVEQNHNLIYSFISFRNLDLDEYYDLLAIVLCRAAMFYKDDNKTKFSTYVYSAFDLELKRVFAFNNRSKRKTEIPIWSLDYEYETEYGIVSLTNLIPDDFDLEEYVEECFLKQAMTEIIKTLNDYEYDYLMEFLSGKTLVSIAKEHNCSKQNVHQIKNRIFKKVGDKLCQYMTI